MLASDATMWLLAAVLTASGAYGIFNGVRWRAFQDRAAAEALREERDRYAEAEREIRGALAKGVRIPAFADPANPDTAGRRRAARYAVMPPGTLGAFGVGQSDLLPSYFRVSTESRENVLAMAETENPTRLLTGRFDLAFVIVYLMPLLILAVSYNLLSGEREQGTLAFVLSQPVTLQRLLAAKVAVRVAAFLGFLLVFVPAAALAAGLPWADPNTAPRVLLWVIVVGAYAAFWFALALAVAATGLPSATAAMTLAGVWLLLTVLLPSAFNLGVMTLYPVPSRVEMVQAVREASDDANEEGARLLGKYYQDHPELAADTNDQAVTDFTVVRLAVDEHIEARVRPVMSAFEGQLGRQQAAIDRLRFLSPAILVQDALNDLVGAGAARHRHFVDQVVRFHTDWRGYFLPRVAKKVQLRDYADVPMFQFEEEPFGAVVARTVVNLAGLLCGAAALAGLGFIRLQRFAVAGS